MHYPGLPRGGGSEKASRLSFNFLHGNFLEVDKSIMEWMIVYEGSIEGSTVGS